MIQFGKDAETWFLPNGLRPTNGPLDTFANQDYSNLVEICEIKNLSLTLTVQTSPATTKCDIDWNVSVTNEKGFGVTFSAPYQIESLGIRELWVAFVERRNIAMVVMDAPLFDPFLGPLFLNSVAKGVWADWIVHDITEQQPIGGVIAHAYTISPGMSFFLDETPPDTEPVGVQRFFPEIILPVAFPA